MTSLIGHLKSPGLGMEKIAEISRVAPDIICGPGRNPAIFSYLHTRPDLAIF